MHGFASTAPYLIFFGLAQAVLGQDWQPETAPAGASIEHLIVSDGVVYGAADGALVISENGGESWRTLGTPAFGSDRYTNIVAGDGRLFATSVGGGNRLWVSEDDGRTWEERASASSLGAVAPTWLRYANGRLFAIFDSSFAGQGALFASDDFGASWERLDLPLEVISVVAFGDVVIATPSAIGTGTLFGSIFRSADGGETWDTIDLVDQGFGLGILGFTEMVASGNSVFGHITGFGNPGVAHSNDGGLTWAQTNTNPASAELDLAVDDGNFYRFSQLDLTGTVARWNDLTSAWESIAPELALEPFGSLTQRYELAVVADAVIASANPRLQVWRSVAGGAFEPSTAGLAHAFVFGLAASDAAVLANSINSSEIWFDSGDGWTRSQLPIGFGEVTLEIDALRPSAEPGLFVVGTQTEGIFLTEDAGETWREINNGVPTYNGSAGLQRREVEAFTSLPTPTGEVWFAGTGRGLEFLVIGGRGQFVVTGGGVLRSDDRGETWREVNNGLPIFVRDAFGDPKFPPVLAMENCFGVVLAATSQGDGVFRMDPGTSFWRRSNDGLPEILPGRFPTASDFTTLDGSVFMTIGSGFAGGNVFRSDDAGRTWERTDFGLPLQAGHAITSRDGVLYASVGNPISAETGVWRSDDAGLSWTKAGLGLEGTVSRDLGFVRGTLYAATDAQSVQSLGGCVADCDGDGEATIFDFLCFQNLFQDGKLAADLDGDGALTLFDFLAFQTAFDAGCD